jgi:5-methylcytosine-specific restriction endonuclease McrA
MLAFPKPKDSQIFPEDSAAKILIRETVFVRDKGLCIDCFSSVRLERGFWDSMHLMHLKSKGSGGDWSLGNLATGCADCHSRRHNSGGKPVQITKAEARK